MKKLTCDSDIGSCLIGNKDWTFAVPNFGGDGTTEIYIFDREEKSFYDFEKKHDLKFISSVQGLFNIYNYDCAFPECDDNDIILTLNGRYGIYRGSWKVVFVKWEDWGSIQGENKYTIIDDFINIIKREFANYRIDGHPIDAWIQEVVINTAKNFKKDLVKKNLPLSNEVIVKEKTIEDFIKSMKSSLLTNYRDSLKIDDDGYEWLTTDDICNHLDYVKEKLLKES